MRDNTIDIMKGLAIIGVVVGHCAPWADLDLWVNQWHLAAFFFAAGYFFKFDCVGNAWGYVRKKVSALYVPFVQMGLVFLALHNVLYLCCLSPNSLTLRDAGREVLSLCMLLTSHEPLMGAMWFCPTLLIASVSMMLIAKITPPRSHKWVYISALAAFVVAAAANRFNVKSPYCVWQCLQTMIVMWAGRAFKGVVDSGRMNWAERWPWLTLAVGAVGLLSLFFTMKMGWRVSLQPAAVNDESALAIMLLTTWAGVSVWLVARALRTCGWLAYIGRHSFAIMALHFLCFKSVHVVACMLYGEPWARMAEFPTMGFDHGWWWMFPYILAGVSLPLLISYSYKTLHQRFSFLPFR